MEYHDTAAMDERDTDISSSESGAESSEDECITSDDEQYPDTITCNKTKNLVTKLRDASVRSAFDKTKFVPEGIIDELINKKMIKSCLVLGKEQTSRKEQANLVNFIFKKAKKAFAVATFAKINSHRAMRWFMKKGLSDQDLPILEQTADWKQSWRTEFYDCQWQFFAPIFSTTIHSHDFVEAQILPVVSISHNTRRGAFGEVSQHELHMNHMEPVSHIEPISGL